MNLKQKESQLFEEYISYFKKHHNAVYIGLGILFLFQIIILLVISFQGVNINSLIENNKISEDKLTNLSYSTELRFSEFNKSLYQNSIIQAEIIRDLEILKLSKDFTSVADKAFNSVVSINAFSSEYTRVMLGSGFFITSGGYAITNYHVIENMKYIDIITKSKETFRAKIIGYNSFKDIALLKIEKNTSYLQLADSNSLKIGQKVIAIGNPLGLDFSVTEGVISGLKRQGDNNLQAYIQTDVPINPGNSGGPLIDSEGKVIGVNTFKYVDSSIEGMGFSLESNEVKATVNQIVGFVLLA